MQIRTLINGPIPKSAVTVSIEDADGINYPAFVHLHIYENGTHKPIEIFGNGDGIADAYVAPNGDYWLISDCGLIYTTSKSNFPTAQPNKVQARFSLKSESISKSGLPWSLYPLQDPTLKPVMGNSIWSPDGINVFVGTYQGSIYQWNGSKFLRFDTPVSLNGEKYIHQISGPTALNLFATTGNGKIIFFDGISWSESTFDTQKNGRVVGLSIGTDQFTYFLSEYDRDNQKGTKLWRSEDGSRFECVGTSPNIRFSSVVVANQVIYLAAGEKGVFGIEGDQFVNLRNTFHCASASGGGHQVLFATTGTENDEGSVLRFVVHPFSDTHPWSRLGYKFSS